MPPAKHLHSISKLILQVAMSFATLLALAGPARADDWQPISAEDLKMTSYPKAPGAPAIILYRRVDRDDQKSTESEYVRIKILTEAGREYANVEIPIYRVDEQVNSIRARTIRPDGSIVNFDGKVYFRPLAKSKQLKVMAKSFTLTDVQVGSIIEYKYISTWQEHLVYDSRWIVSQDLFTRRADFTLLASTYFPVRWNWIPLPGDQAPVMDVRGIVRFQANDVPAFQTEDYMPPPNELKSRVDFIYSEDSESSSERFWKNLGKKYNGAFESFTNKRKAMEQEVASIVAPADTPELKLHKIYDRVLKIHNISMDVAKSGDEQKRDKEKEVANVEDLLRKGRGNGRQINWLFIALARAAGFEAYSVYVAPRSEYFFNPKMMDSQPLNGDIALVKLNGIDTYFDPAAIVAPFGFVLWQETNVQGLRLDKDGGTWVNTTTPPSSASRVERKANLKLTEEGTVQGKVTVTFTGLEAVRVRREELREDEANRKQYLEDLLKSYIPTGAEVELTNKPDWTSATDQLVAEYDVKIEGWVSAAGKRAVLPVGLFTNSEKHIFEHSVRVHPIYVSFPMQENDDLSIELPLGWHVSSLPAAQKQDGHIVEYALKIENDKDTLHLSRVLNLNFLILEAKYYAALRNFYQLVRSGDDEKVLLQPGSSAAAN